MDAVFHGAAEAKAPSARPEVAEDPARFEHCLIGERHRVVRHLASGGMGHVFLARHLTLGGCVAVKVLPRTVDRVAARAFHNEARLLSRLNHPNIVRVVDYGRLPGGDRYLIMELLVGLELGSWLDWHGAMPAQRGLWVLRQAAAAIDYLHDQGIVHRDIKPNNIMLQDDANDSIKLVDFGVAFRPGSGKDGASGVVVGTPAYMAPEQARGEVCDRRIDLYALGACAFELLVGRPLYDAGTPEQTLRAVSQGQRPPRPSERGLCVNGLDAVMEKALATDPARRYPSGQAFVDALAEVFAHPVASATFERRSEPCVSEAVQIAVRPPMLEHAAPLTLACEPDGEHASNARGDEQTQLVRHSHERARGWFRRLATGWLATLI